MKCAIVLTDGIKQIMLTPENDSEKQALRMITRDDDITIETAWGMFYDSRPLGYDVSECGGGYLRGFRSDESLMLVLRRKAAKQTEAGLPAPKTLICPECMKERYPIAECKNCRAPFSAHTPGCGNYVQVEGKYVCGCLAGHEP